MRVRARPLLPSLPARMSNLLCLWAPQQLMGRLRFRRSPRRCAGCHSRRACGLCHSGREGGGEDRRTCAAAPAACQQRRRPECRQGVARHPDMGSRLYLAMRSSAGRARGFCALASRTWVQENMDDGGGVAHMGTCQVPLGCGRCDPAWKAHHHIAHCPTTDQLPRIPWLIRYRT